LPSNVSKGILVSISLHNLPNLLIFWSQFT
jgi:hypothetical protein